jgi:hypothetical protein
LAIVAKNPTQPENAVSRFLHFQRLRWLKMAGRPATHGKRGIFQWLPNFTGSRELNGARHLLFQRGRAAILCTVAGVDAGTDGDRHAPEARANPLQLILFTDCTDFAPATNRRTPIFCAIPRLR